MYREDSQMQSLAKSVFDFSMNDDDRFKLLIETQGFELLQSGSHDA